MNESNMDTYWGPKRHFDQEQNFIDFYIQMNQECSYNHTRVFWEWMRNAPCFDDYNVNIFRLFRENGEAVCSVRPASPWPSEAMVDNRSNNRELLSDVIQYIEDNYVLDEENKKKIYIISSDSGNTLDQLLTEIGYEKLSSSGDTLQFSLDQPLKKVPLKAGYSIHSLSEVFDFDQLSRLIWHGFHYEGEVPKVADPVRSSIKHAWLNYNRDLCSVILDQNGDYACFCGFWFDSVTHTAYLEPMITREQDRNLGLGKAAVYHSLEVLRQAGCKRAFVDPDEEPYPYYKKIGFQSFDYHRVYHKIL